MRLANPLDKTPIKVLAEKAPTDVPGQARETGPNPGPSTPAYRSTVSSHQNHVPHLGARRGLAPFCSLASVQADLRRESLTVALRRVMLTVMIFSSSDGPSAYEHHTSTRHPAYP